MIKFDKSFPIIQNKSKIIGFKYDKNSKKLSTNEPLFVKLRRYILRKITQEDKDKLDELLSITSKLRNSKENKILTEKLIKVCDSVGIAVYKDLSHIAFSYYTSRSNSKGGEIHISEDPIACVFAHELGHGLSYNGKGTLADRISGSLYGWGHLITMIGNYGLYPILGIISGVTLGSVGLLIGTLPYLIYSPVLHQENFASSKGIQLLKEAGASDEYIQLSKDCLKAAYHTYVKSPIGSVIISLIGWASGFTSTFSDSSEIIETRNYSIFSSKVKPNISHSIILKNEILNNQSQWISYLGDTAFTLLLPIKEIASLTNSDRDAFIKNLSISINGFSKDYEVIVAVTEIKRKYILNPYVGLGFYMDPLTGAWTKCGLLINE